MSVLLSVLVSDFLSWRFERRFLFALPAFRTAFLVFSTGVSNGGIGVAVLCSRGRCACPEAIGLFCWGSPLLGIADAPCPSLVTSLLVSVSNNVVVSVRVVLVCVGVGLCCYCITK